LSSVSVISTCERRAWCKGGKIGADGGSEGGQWGEGG